MRSITITVDGETLKGFLFYPPNEKDKNPAVLFIHGWTSAQDRYTNQAKDLTGLGVVCLTFDLRGHGGSAGDINNQTRQDFLDDVTAAYDLLIKDNKIDPNNITVIGSSFGSCLAVLLARHRKVKNLILRVPANYPDALEGPIAKANQDEVYKSRHLGLQNPSNNMALAALHNFNGNVLIIESSKDEIIPHQTIEDYINAMEDKTKLDHIVMEGAPHSLTGSPELKKQAQGITRNWLEGKIK